MQLKATIPTDDSSTCADQHSLDDGDNDTGHTEIRLKTADTSEKMTKKERKETAADQKPSKHVGEDPSKLIAELSPGKKGGDYELPFGGQVNIPAAILGKRDVVTCCMMSPSDRYKYMPPLKSGENLLSEIYLIGMTMKNIKKEIRLRLPYKDESSELFHIEMLWKRVETDSWETKEFSFSKKGRYVELTTGTGGIFVVVSRPRMETFVIPVQGCLYNSRLSHQVSVRFPKKATSIDLTCDIIISPVNKENIPNLARDFPLDMHDLLAISDYVTIRTDIPTEFKRAATVKLPLPQLATEEFAEDDMVVMEFDGEAWKLHESLLKFTKSSVMFDTHTLTRYCVAQSAPQRRKRLVNAFKRIHDEESVVRGQVLPSVHIQTKLWTLYIDVVPNEQVESCSSKRGNDGFRSASLREIIPETDIDHHASFRRNWKASQPKQVDNKPDREDLDLRSGHLFDFELSGDIRLNADNATTHRGIYFYEKLDENYRKFVIEPRLGKDFVPVTGALKIYKAIGDNTSGRVCVRHYNIDVTAEEVEAFFYEAPPTPEPQPEPVLPAVENPPCEPVTSVATVRSEFGRPQTASFLRLTTPTRPARRVIKESRVLSGKSLRCLAREIEQGLTLAIHLDISDSCITGLGFDALANGLNLTEITYRILLLWKRRTSKMKDEQVGMLIGALQDMGRHDAAAIVGKQHKYNKELTSDCFEMPHYSEGDLYLQ